MIDIDAFHFLRPHGLWLIVGAALLVVAWHVAADPRSRWRGLIAPHLLERLIVNRGNGLRLRPVHSVALGLTLIGLAVAGPTWEQTPPPFTEDRAPMMVALDLSTSMGAADIPPTRLARARQKIRDLMHARAGSRTGLIAYAGTAHLVLPPTDDAAMMTLFLDALSPALMPRAGKNAAAALAQADALLSREPVAGTIVFITDGFERAQIPAFAQYAKSGSAQVLIWAVGTEAGGPVRRADGQIATDARGRPLFGAFDLAGLRALADEAGLPLASMRLDDDDIGWIERRAQAHLQEAAARHAAVRWREAGYWLTFPIALLGLAWFRRGWVVRWLPSVLVGVCVAAGGLGTRPAQAAPFRLIDAFMTHDQQGRRAFEQGDYARAATLFDDPMWQGQAYYRAANYNAALAAFARVNTPEAFFMMGNCYARLKDFPKAVMAYDNALAMRADFETARANRALVASLIPAPAKAPQDGEHAPDLPPDQIKFDDKAAGGKRVRIDRKALDKEAADLWMRNLQTSPADFLRQKFALEAARPASAGKPTP
jgi:Ca-activated chloride channel homolog